MTSWIDIDDLGAVGDGVTDDTAAFMAGFALFPKGGVIRLTAGKKYYTQSFTLPWGICIEGPGETGGSNVYDASWFSKLTCLLIDPASTITMKSGSGMRGLTVQPKGMGFPQANSTAWTGTALSTNTGVNECDVFLENVRVMGFQQAFLGINCPRLRLDKFMFDCNSGVYINNAGDCVRPQNCHGWPYATVSGPSGSSNNRSGISYYFIGNTDGGTVTNCFSTGYSTGFYVNGMNGLRFIGCGAEQGITGFWIDGAAQNIELTACQSNGEQNNVLISTSDIHHIVSVNGGMFGAATDSDVRVFAGTCAVRNAALQSSVSQISLAGTAGRVIAQNNNYYGNSGAFIRLDGGATSAQVLVNSGNVNI